MRNVLTPCWFQGQRPLVFRKVLWGGGQSTGLEASSMGSSSDSATGYETSGSPSLGFTFLFCKVGAWMRLAQNPGSRAWHLHLFTKSGQSDPDTGRPLTRVASESLLAADFWGLACPAAHRGHAMLGHQLRMAFSVRYD